jgi:hypothetical protein
MLVSTPRLSDRSRRRVSWSRERLSVQDVEFPGRREKHKAAAISDNKTRRAMESFYDVVVRHNQACRCEWRALK